MATFADCDGDPIQIPSGILEDIREVHERSEVSVRNWRKVAESAASLGFRDAEEWIRENRFDYTCGIRNGWNAV